MQLHLGTVCVDYSLVNMRIGDVHLIHAMRTKMAFAVYGFSALHSLNMCPGHEGMQVLRLRA
jgi:hypothetical protein